MGLGIGELLLLVLDGHRNDDHSFCVHCDLLNQCGVINRDVGKGPTGGRILRAAIRDVKSESRALNLAQCSWP
jgi:hypothetical protein